MLYPPFSCIPLFYYSGLHEKAGGMASSAIQRGPTKNVSRTRPKSISSFAEMKVSYTPVLGLAI